MNGMTQPKKASTLEILVSIIDCMIQNSYPKVLAVAVYPNQPKNCSTVYSSNGLL